MQVYAGSYTGNGVNDRAISVGFQPDLLFLKDEDSSGGIARSGSFSYFLLPTSGASLQLKSFNSDGFVVGTGTPVNFSGRIYRFAAMKMSTDEMEIGSYVGSGLARSITTLFSPNLVSVADTSNVYDIGFRLSLMAADAYHRYEGRMLVGSSHFNGFGATSFNLLTNNNVNANGKTYSWFSMKNTSGTINAGQYTGNGVNGLAVSVGFQSDFIVLSRADETAGTIGWFKGFPTGESVPLHGGIKGTGWITGVSSTGFTVGSSGTVNANGGTYNWFAVKNAAAAPSTPIFTRLERGIKGVNRGIYEGGL